MAAGRAFDYQVWKPGRVSFESAAGTAVEPAEDFIEKRIVVKRVGGTSGVAKARVDVAEGSTALDGIYEFAEAGEEHTWAEGEDGDWTLAIKVLSNQNCDGAQTVKLRLTALEGSDVAVADDGADYTLTIADDETAASPGKLRIASTTPAKAGRYVYAKASEGVVVRLDRTGGTDGTVRGVLTATKGAFDRDTFTWQPRSAGVQEAKLTFTDVASGGTANVKLKPVDGSKVVSSSNSFTVKIIADDAPSFEQDSVAYTVYKSVAMTAEEISVENSLDGAVKVTKVAGTIPGGVRAAYDESKQALVFSGTPTSGAGKFEAVYQVSAGSVKGMAVSVTFTVVNPFKPSAQTGVVLNEACAKTRTFAELQVYNDADRTRLVGLVTLTVPPSGRLSAKYASRAGTVSLLSRNWASIDGDNALTAELIGTTAKTQGYRMTVKACPDGALECTFLDPTCHADSLAILSANDARASLAGGEAADWAGYYTVSLAQRNAADSGALAKGDGYLTLKMTTRASIQKGRMAYAGVLPNGKAFSGSRTLWGCYSEDFKKNVLAYLPVFNTSTSDDVSGLVLIEPNALETHADVRRSVFGGAGSGLAPFGANRFVWTSKEGQKAGLDYEADFDVYGGIYDADEDFAGCCVDTFETDELTFFAMPQVLDAEAVWSTNDTQISAAPIVKTVNRKEVKTNSLALLQANNEQGLTLSFSRATGVVSGALNLTVDGVLTRAAYKGVVLPGWGSASCVECSAPSDAQKRPFVSGFCSFAKKAAYSDAAGKARSVKVSVSCPFSIGLEEGR